MGTALTITIWDWETEAPEDKELAQVRSEEMEEPGFEPRFPRDKSPQTLMGGSVYTALQKTILNTAYF